MRRKEVLIPDFPGYPKGCPYFLVKLSTHSNVIFLFMEYSCLKLFKLDRHSYSFRNST